MSTKIFSRTLPKNTMYLQAYVLLVLGIVCLLIALLIHPSTNEYPVGVMIFGLGMLIACLVNPYRLVIASFLTTALGIAVYLFFKHLIPGNEVFPEYIIAMGIGLIGIALMGRRGFVGAGALTPGIFVLGVGIIEFWLINGYSIGSLTPERFITFMLSIWLPGIGLTILGFTYLLISTRK
ncbi:MAG: hypothetical protein ACXWPS_17835 [Ktedonobacteraceae bacterium]